MLPVDAVRSRARRRCQPDPEQPSSRQDRLADAREVDGVCGLARRALPAAERGDAAGRGRRPRRHQDATALAHGGEDAVGALVCRWQLSRSLSAHGLVDGAREGPLVRRAGRRRSSRRSRRSSTSVIRHLRPPPYPYEIDATLAARGKALFYSEEIGCARCHGVYDGRGNVEWPGVHKDVGTDRGPPRRRLGQVHRRVRPEPAGRGRRARQEPGIRGHAADRRLGELSVPAQRQRADAPSPARPGVGAAGDLPRDARPAASIGRVSASSSTSIPSTARATRPTSFAGLAPIATGSTPRVPVPATAVTMSGRASARTRTAARSSSTLRRCDGSPSPGLRRVLAKARTHFTPGDGGLGRDRHRRRSCRAGDVARAGTFAVSATGCSNAATSPGTRGRTSTTAWCSTPAGTCRRCPGWRFRPALRSFRHAGLSSTTCTATPRRFTSRFRQRRM